MGKETIFISHANPEDNYFAGWLASKLLLLGYKAWVDVEDFNTGDAFFTKISSVIGDESIRFIAVNSKSYLRKAKNQDTGVSRELNAAILVNIENFILPIRIDSSKFNEFPAHYASRDAIDFSGNWQTGLIKLVEQFEKTNIPKNTLKENPLELWYRTIKNRGTIIERDEPYFSNWFPTELPEMIYVHWLDKIPEKIYEEFPYPFILEGDRMITFCPKEITERLLFLKSSHTINSEEFHLGDYLHIDDYFGVVEPKKKLVKLMNAIFKAHLTVNGLSYWHSRRLHYFPVTLDGKKSISLRKRYGKTSRVLTGKKTLNMGKESKVFNWHYAVSHNFDIHPNPHYKIFYTIVGTNEDGTGLGKKLNQRLRRSVAADWFNRKWFEMMLAAMLKISPSEESESIEIDLGASTPLRIDNSPLWANSPVGYTE